uniref:Succinate:cytochrome c oxidoreductase subunit 3 n=1 Tax=Lithothamnion sp. TaxID=1940749 RepID=A0A3G3MIF4_9FLOR|nr:succinate:cytochrome c oxidoreductase subunit 3 [Lithothamnion sp.]
MCGRFESYSRRKKFNYLLKKVFKILNRPLSPHLTIYTSQITSIYSIWHRIAGVVLIFLLIIFLVLCKMSSFIILNTKILKIYFCTHLWIKNCIFFNVTLLLLYHLINGLRHINWDLGFNLSINLLLNSAKISILLLFIFWILLLQRIIN